MLDDMFSFIDPIIELNDDGFSFTDNVEILFESPEQFIAGYDINAVLSDKVKEIIETQWGRKMTDLQDLYIGQFHERLEENGQILYRPTDRYILRAKFPYMREPRRMIFQLPTL